jgi:hypothetical protein
MRRTLARLEIKERHIAGVRARWDKQEERDRAAAATSAAFGKPEIRAKYVASSNLRWSKPESTGQRARFAKPREKEKQSVRIRNYAAANPDAMARNSRQKTEQWADSVREKFLAAQRAGNAKMIAGPRAKPVETLEGVFPSLTAAANHRNAGARLAKKGVALRPQGHRERPAGGRPGRRSRRSFPRGS